MEGISAPNELDLNQQNVKTYMKEFMAKVVSRSSG